MSSQEEIDLWTKAQAGDMKSRDALVFNNMRLVVRDAVKINPAKHTTFPTREDHHHRSNTANRLCHHSGSK